MSFDLKPEIPISMLTTKCGDDRMSFDLKPEIPIRHMTTKCICGDDIVWTVNRSPVPPLLAERNISESMWGRTFDLVHGHYDKQLKTANYFNFCFPAKLWLVFPFVLPCFIPCLLAKIMQLDRRNTCRWLEILESQKEIYQRFGIEVTTTNSSGASMGSACVGLQFTVADGPPPIGFTKKAVEADDEVVPISIV